MELQLTLVALIAGVLTVLAPCILPVLPVVVGRSATSTKDRIRPLVITGSLMLSVVATTLIIRASVLSVGFRAEDLQPVAGVILMAVGLFTLFPEIWEYISLKLKLSTESNRLLARFAGRSGLAGDGLIGASLGPVFTSCSPTFAVIIGLVLTGEVTAGALYLTVYTLGLGATMLAVAYAGQSLIHKLQWAVNPHGAFRRILGILFLLLGLAIFTGYIKDAETWLLENGFYDPIAEFENDLRN